MNETSEADSAKPRWRRVPQKAKPDKPVRPRVKPYAVRLRDLGALAPDSLANERLWSVTTITTTLEVRKQRMSHDGTRPVLSVLDGRQLGEDVVGSKDLRLRDVGILAVFWADTRKEARRKARQRLRQCGFDLPSFRIRLAGILHHPDTERPGSRLVYRCILRIGNTERKVASLELEETVARPRTDGCTNPVKVV